jgi:Protein of unknown function (DUF3237)
MRLEPLYRMRFTYPEEFGVDLAGPGGTESLWYFRLEGRCEGRISGNLQGVNHPRRRTDHTFVPDTQGVIETDDGAVILFDCHGYGRSYPPGKRQIVISQTHMTDDERYKWLNDVVCVGTGEVRTADDGASTVLVVDIAELIWEPISE